jgi:ribosomal 50S subunit-recycling heat shock protein
MELNAVRIDKWLWAARFFKTRGAATEAVLGGRVHVNGERVKPSKEVRAGDVVEMTKRGVRWTVSIQDVADRRGPAAVAAQLYEETPESRWRASSRHSSVASPDRSAPTWARGRRSRHAAASRPSAGVTSGRG